MEFISIALRLSVVSALTLLCGWSAWADQVHEYFVKISPKLNQLHVRAELHEPSSSVRLEARRSKRNLRQLRHCDSDESLSLRYGRITTAVQCFEYSVYLRNSDRKSRWTNNNYGVKDRMTSPVNWMLMPDGDETRYRVHFDTPKGINVSVPWQPVGNNIYEFRRYALSSEAITVFGPFKKRLIDVPGGQMRVALLRTRHASEDDKIMRWLQSAAANVSTAHGNFPLKSVQVLVIPVNDRANEPVPFGRVIRDGGEAVQFFVDTARPLNEFIRDWTATHEFSHLLMPYVGDRWVSEGFASYYQNVLLARGGIYSEKTAWRKLYEGFGRGKLAAPGLSPRSATMRNGGLMKMYWSGAALALMGDIELRRLSDGATSLDDVFKKLRYCCLPSRHTFTDREFFQKLDEISGYSVFGDLYQDYANASGFPDYMRVLNSIGVDTHVGKIRFIKHEDSWIRDDIMRKPSLKDAENSKSIGSLSTNPMSKNG